MEHHRSLLSQSSLVTWVAEARRTGFALIREGEYALLFCRLWSMRMDLDRNRIPNGPMMDAEGVMNLWEGKPTN